MVRDESQEAVTIEYQEGLGNEEDVPRGGSESQHDEQGDEGILEEYSGCGFAGCDYCGP
jgi:hypothetical protein